MGLELPMRQRLLAGTKYSERASLEANEPWALPSHARAPTPTDAPPSPAPHEPARPSKRHVRAPAARAHDIDTEPRSWPGLACPAMDHILTKRFDHIEQAVHALVESIAAYNPSPQAAIDLVAADDELSRGLDLRMSVPRHAPAAAIADP